MSQQEIVWFIAVFTKAHHWTLYGASWIQSTPSHPIRLWSVSVLTSCLPEVWMWVKG